MAIYRFMTSLKSVSSMKMHCDLNFAQNSAWHLSRLLAILCQQGRGFAGPAKVDETYPPHSLSIRRNHVTPFGTQTGPRQPLS